jgi:phospholipid transport system substrate-binding protein
VRSTVKGFAHAIALFVFATFAASAFRLGDGGLGIGAPSAAAEDDSGGEVAAASSPAKGDEQGAVTAVEKLHATIIDAMKRAAQLKYEGRYSLLEPVIDQTFDLPFMAEKSAGKYWNDFNDEQKKRWTDTFSRMTKANYAGRFNGYSSQRFDTLGTEPAGFDTLLVRTKLVQPQKADEDVEINYRMHRSASGWKIVDIYLSGTVSELALRRAEYGSVLQRDGFDKLIAQLDSKIGKLKSGASD